MLNKKFKLQDTLDVYISEVENDKVVVTFSRMTTRERLEIIAHRNVATLLACLNGKQTVSELLTTLGHFDTKQALKLLDFLQSKHLIYETDNKVTENSRYSRQIAYFDDMVLNQSGNESQQKLQTKHIVIIGCGAVTGAIAEILARAGVEKFTLIDDKKVRQSDLLRHLFCRLNHIGTYKTDVLANYLKKINYKVETKVFREKLLPKTDLNHWITADVDLVINGCDEPYIGHTSLKIGRFLQTKNIPMYIMGGFDAHLMSSGELVFPPQTPCIDCCQQTFQKALADWKPIYSEVEKPDMLVKEINNTSISHEQLFDIGGSGGLSAMSLFSANLSCLRIIQFLIGDTTFNYKTERYEYLINKGEMTSFEMIKQINFCGVCNG
ncbi:ThiF family adenylyltransferase [Neisseria sp. Dent CA1/247]|uniref:HesA/MoeB/ThiF family protein n=1 Tax=Neisseria sp. Dent CA1/247 TaxID=2912675 RepID=UPI001FD3C8B9|nr:ThiF family adenylyltransferase [Neisseria sp. Dent CA1/247]UOO77372.1 ThiF family adenylyltransferase [Neisseria sp. Dent CA1/247]